MKAALLGVLVVGIAAGQETPSSAPAAPASTSVAPSTDDAIAKRHFQTGTLYYESGRFEDAARQFEAAHRLSRRPALQYNIAQCYERLFQAEKAWEAYRAYLRGMPEAPDRAFVEARIAELEKQIAARKEAVAPALAPIIIPGGASPQPGATTALSPETPSAYQEVSRDEPLYKKWWFWGVVGAVVAGGVVAAVVLSSGDSDSMSEVEQRITDFPGKRVEF